MSLPGEPPATQFMEGPGLRDYLWLMWARKGSIMAVLAMVMGGLLIQFSNETKLYRSSTEVLVRPLAKRPGGLEIYESYPNMEPARRVATSEEVERLVAMRLGAIDDRTDVIVEAPPNSNTLIFRVTSPDPRRAQRTAAAYADAYLESRLEDLLADLSTALQPLEARLADVNRLIDDLQYQLAIAPESARGTLGTRFTSLLGQRHELEQQRNDLIAPQNNQVGRVLQPADLPEAPITPSRLKSLVVALFLGGALGAGQAVARAQFLPRVQGRSDLALQAGAPVLALVPRLRRGKTGLVTLQAPRSKEAEAYGRLRAGVVGAQQQQAPRTLLVTSPNAGEGKSLTAANLAVSLTQAGKLVVLVSTEPSGATLNGNGSHPVALTGVSVEGLRVLAGRSPGTGPHSRLDLGAMRSMIGELEREADFVIIDAPPVLGTAETLAVAPLADAVLMVAGADRTTWADVRDARLRLGQVGARLTGTVLNNVGAARMRFEHHLDQSTGSYPAAVSPPPPPARVAWRDDWSLRF